MLCNVTLTLRHHHQHSYYSAVNRSKRELAHNISDGDRKKTKKLYLFAGIDVVSNTKVHIFGAAATERAIIHLMPTHTRHVLFGSQFIVNIFT